MSEEEQEAREKAIDIVLNYISKLQKENTDKNIVIDYLCEELEMRSGLTKEE